MFLGLSVFAGTILGGSLLGAMIFRRVVETNEVHVVQSSNNTKSYGTGQEYGNVYWEIPSWVPIFGVTKVVLPVSNFDLSLEGYVAYDQDRVPFVADITAFFRIDDTNTAAKRAATFEQLQEQLLVIVQGAVRSILASHKIDSIMLERAKFGDQFTKEVGNQVKQWGVVPVKNIELMDIRDAEDSQVIENIMAKKQSFIEMESRKEVAENNREAEMAEIAAKREVDMEQQKALQAVGERTAEKDKAVGIAQQKSKQEVAVQEKVTREKEMEVTKVEEVKRAEINKEKEVVKAEETKQTTAIKAEGDLIKQQRDAEGVLAAGKAKAEAEKLILLAPVDAQITLAKEIGANAGYQGYLVKLEEIKANQIVGVEQAKALTAADIKVIANTGNPVSGVNSVMDLFTSAGGTNVASAVEALAQTPAGNALLTKFGVNVPPKAKKPEAAKTTAK